MTNAETWTTLALLAGALTAVVGICIAYVGAVAHGLEARLGVRIDALEHRVTIRIDNLDRDVQGLAERVRELREGR